MSVLAWIVLSGLLMSAIALVGGLTLLMSEQALQRLLQPLVALAAGSLLGGAFFHMLPASVAKLGNTTAVYGWLLIGFTGFLALEQFLHWHHCHKTTSEHKQPLTYLLLIADGVHNFIGGMAVAGAFLADVRLGILTWAAAAAHEIPQELGDFGVLIQGGWSKRRALGFNLLSALTFPLGGLITYAAAQSLDVTILIPFAAGNFIYIAAADLIPEIKSHTSLKQNAIHFACFSLGLLLLYASHVLFG